MSDRNFFSEKEIDDLLIRESSVIRKATKKDRILLKNELNKKLKECKKTSKFDMVETFENLLEGIETIDFFVQSENKECIIYSYELVKSEDGYTFNDSGFLTVKY
ncbi:hypothetical protein [Bacillus sp. 37MA]|uniref:hypothetical protein n=1 Tax=Bacillus sp. 37MA TaxID=1132442 RepID=UPI00036FAC1D|nr:hypothetical protein [Bacillus sp. 37MA]